MDARLRRAVSIVATASLLAAAALFWHSRDAMQNAQAVERGEEVYASHDCTDCHLAAPALRQKNARNQPGLIRVRRSLQEVQQFLAADARHRSYTTMAQNDRDDLIAYLRVLLPR